MLVSTLQPGSPFSFALGDCFAEVERHTYFQLSVTYRTDQITKAMLLKH